MSKWKLTHYNQYGRRDETEVFSTPEEALRQFERRKAGQRWVGHQAGYWGYPVEVKEA